MARINVEQTVLTDTRYKVLAAALGVSKWDAVGRMVAVWSECQERESYVLNAETLNILHDDVPCFSEALLKSGLGKAHRHGIYISGTRGRIEWLQNKRRTGRENGKLGGRPKKTQAEPIENQDGLREKTPLAPALAPALTKKQEATKSAREQVEEFTPSESDQVWATKNAPSVEVETETEAWKERCRANGYRTNAGPIKNATASWMTAMRNAEKWGTYANRRPNPRRTDTNQAAPREGLATRHGIRTFADLLRDNPELQNLQGTPDGGSNDPLL